MRAFIFLAVAFTMFISTPTVAQEVTPDATYGLCIDWDTYTDYYFVTAKSVTADTYALNGYWVGHDDRTMSGTLRVAQGLVHIGINAVFASFPESPWIGTYTLTLFTPPNMWGNIHYMYTFISGGELAASTGSDTAQLYVCSDPDVAPEGPGRSSTDAGVGR